MPIENTWLIADRVMGLRLWDTVTNDDLLQIDKALIEALDSSPAEQVHFISHELDLVQEPSISAYVQLKIPRHARFGYYVVIQPPQNILARFVTRMACTVFKINFTSVESEERAWQYLHQMDATISMPAQSVVEA
ncbi:hypothetical protein HC776_00695 [bacterium]|nr:hypothetical protein [bacterium]